MGETDYHLDGMTYPPNRSRPIKGYLRLDLEPKFKLYDWGLEAKSDYIDTTWPSLEDAMILANTKLQRCFGVSAIAAACVVALVTWRSGLSVEAVPPNASRAYLLGEAERADARHDFRRELELLSMGLTATGSNEELAEIRRMQARVHWKVYEDYSKARQILEEAWTEPTGRNEAALELARLEFAAGRFDASRDAGNRALDAATSRGERYDATVAIAFAVVEQATRSCFANEPIDLVAVQRTALTLDALLKSDGGNPSTARILMKAALLAGDGPTALSAWREYYVISDEVGPPEAIRNGAHAMRTALPNWTGDGQQESTSRTIAIALADTRLFTEAAIVVRASPPTIRKALEQNVQVSEILAYESFLATLERAMYKRYLLEARLESSNDPYWEPFEVALAELWRKLGKSSSTLPHYTSNESAYTETIERALSTQFGCVVRFVDIDGHRGLQMGHIVKDDRRSIDQYGHRATVRFVVLDSMVSNGFASWAWNSGAQHGGWTETDRIVQIRPPYASKPFHVWRGLVWEEDRFRKQERIEKETEADRLRAESNPNGYLPGLAMRLHHQGASGLLEKLRGRGLAEEELRLAFCAEYARAIEESSIFAHEGRHLVDRKIRIIPVRSWRKEYDAKLSEVAFASEPRLALGAIFASNIGDAGAHGKANEQIMKGLVTWMKKNRSNIAEYDAGLPVLPQFDRLTNDQIREAFRSMDSLAE